MSAAASFSNFNHEAFNTQGARPRERAGASRDQRDQWQKHGKTIPGMAAARMVLFLLLTAAFLVTRPMTARADALPDVTLNQDYIGPGASGWKQAEDGSWQYMYFGQLVRDRWEEIGTHWYLFNAEGAMLTGWQTVGEESFYLAEATDESHPMGACFISERTPDGSQVNERGARVADPEPGAIVRPNPYGYSCVEVDITNQMMYCYIDNNLVLASACVTGNASRHMTTPGSFRINSKERSRYLQGYNDNGTKYKSWVNYWMPFNGGQGLHDATWRSSFGGSIYIYGGSHGCVNLPLDVAAALYSIVWVGMPVNVHL